MARGLARNVQAYKSHLAACALSRRIDLNGRGPLSEESLADLTRFFLTTCLDRGVLVSASTRAPLRLAFPAALAPRWTPGLFPEL